MSPYEAGFDAGERAAFDDGRSGVRRAQPPVNERRNAYQRGWWEGYLARSSAWINGKRTLPEWKRLHEESL